MFSQMAVDYFDEKLSELRGQHLFKEENFFTGRQSTEIVVDGSPTPLLNLCSNNYLGLAGSDFVVEHARAAVAKHGYGLASVRFICGTQDIHKNLEMRLSNFLNTERTILYSSCFDANTGLFETLFDERDLILSDELNHASIIDGMRLSKASRYRYRNNDMADLEQGLKGASEARFRVVVTDGVFSMDGTLANLPAICELAEKYDAMVVVDDSHAVGVFGPSGAGTPEHFGVQDKVDLLTGTLGKALGGASGGYTSGRAPLIEYLRQRSRPYLFSNSLAPMIVETSLAVLDHVAPSGKERSQLWENTHHFRSSMKAEGFSLGASNTPIIPVMVGDADVAVRMAQLLLQEGIYVVAFFYPVVPMGTARIRVQISAAHTRVCLDKAVAAFIKVGRIMNVI